MPTIADLLGFYRRAFEATRTALEQDSEWWPSQPQATVLAQALAMEWANAEHLGTAREHAIWISTSLGTLAGAKLKLLHEHYGVSLPPVHASPRDRYAPRGNRRLSQREFLLDFTLWPLDDAEGDHLLLSMESECYGAHGVGDTVTLDDGYSYDFYKLLLVPSPRRLFFARVNGDAQRRDTLLGSLQTLTVEARDRGYLRDGDELLAVILSAAGTHRNNSRAAVWAGDHFEMGRPEPRP